MSHQLLTIADAQHRLFPCENGGINGGTPGVVNTTGTARNDDASGRREFRSAGFAWAGFGGDTKFADLTCDQVTILPPGIEDNNLWIRVQAFGRQAGACPTQCFVSAAASRCPLMRCTIIFLAVSTRARARGMASTARCTSGSVCAMTRSLSSLLNAVTYISMARP